MQIYKFAEQIKSTRKFKVQWKNKCELLIWLSKVQYSKMILNKTASLMKPYLNQIFNTIMVHNSTTSK